VTPSNSASITAAAAVYLLGLEPLQGFLLGAVVASTDAARAEWFSFDNLPELAFDHAKILDDARNALAKLVSTDLGDDASVVFSFLPEEFTLSQAQVAFETIKGEPLETRNFRKWINSHWDREDLEKKTTGGRHRPASLYKLKGRRKAA